MPQPTEKTTAIGRFGHSFSASWSAASVGLLASTPPSTKVVSVSCPSMRTLWTHGAKKVGAALVASTHFHSGQVREPVSSPSGRA